MKASINDAKIVESIWDLILDVGCGSFPSGNVNCDLYIKDVGHRWQDGTEINYKRIGNFVLCDVQHLPFRANIFSSVYSSHV